MAHPVVTALALPLNAEVATDHEQKITVRLEARGSNYIGNLARNRLEDSRSASQRGIAQNDGSKSG
jgi:hypothetical protein